MIFVGIDVAKDKHDCFILNSEGTVLADVFTIANNRIGFETLLSRIQSCSQGESKIKVGLEATGHYSYNLLGFLLDSGLATYVINPLHTNLYRKSLSLRRTKTDRIDARTIAMMLMSDPVSLADISAHLSQYGITADPRTLRKDIEQLVEFGVDIVKDRRVQNLYHVATRHFEAPEVKLLIDAVQSARFITPGKSKELVKRLTAFVAPGDAVLLKRHLYIDSRVKAVNESIYISVDRIQTAIAERKKIAFRYFDYSPSKERVHRHDGQVYSVSPYALLWNNDIYYLVGFHDHRQQVVKFRVDRIDGLKVTQKAAVQKPKDFDVSAYFTQEFSMLTGKTCHITLLCENPLMNSIIDRFGEDAPTQIVDENHFTVEATVDLSSNFYGWVFSSGGKMKITAPQEAVDGFQRMLEINSNPPVKTSHLKGGQA